MKDFFDKIKGLFSGLKIKERRMKVMDTLSSKAKTLAEKESVKKVLQFFTKNRRYFAAIALLIALGVLLYACTGPEHRRPVPEELPEDNTQTEATEEPAGTQQDTPAVEFVLDENFEVDAVAEVNALISSYFKAYEKGDVDTLSSLASPMGDNEKSYIRVFSEFIESYQNMKCYTKHGLSEGSYLVSVYFDMKFQGVSTPAPGLDFFYLERSEDGKLYINNIYSPYNLSRNEEQLDPNVYAVILRFEQSEDSIDLRKQVENAYLEAVSSDMELATMISVTIPNAMEGWLESLNAASTESESEEPVTETESEDPYGAETQPTETEQPQTSEQPEQPEQVENSSGNGSSSTAGNTSSNKEKTVKVRKKSVNVRKKASPSSEAIGYAQKGDVFTKLGEEGDWTKIDFYGKTGYIMTSLVKEVTE